jgi:hypothetical protein
MNSILRIGLFLITIFSGNMLFAQAGLGLRFISLNSPEHGITTFGVPEKKYDFGVHYRWFDADQVYVGNNRRQELEDANTHDIFNSHSISLNVGYMLNKRWSFFAALPLVWNQKSSVQEHSIVNDNVIRLQRRVTEAIGIGDLFVGTDYQITNRSTNTIGSLTATAAVKIPTGDYQVTDRWQGVGPGRSDLIRPVDPAIQPGDGTWGALLGLRGSLLVFDWLGAYGEAKYLATPADTNGVSTFRNTISHLYDNEGSTSVPDQFMGRIGISLRVPGSVLILNSGIRIDGIPVNDLIGKSNGFRRPGFATTWENGVTVQSKDFSFYVTIPYVYFQTRYQSNPDRAYSLQNSTVRHGEGAFARFMVYAGLQARI